MSEQRLVEVALPLPLHQTFTYAVKEEPGNPLLPGSRVVVPLRQAKAIGICLGASDGKRAEILWNLSASELVLANGSCDAPGLRDGAAANAVAIHDTPQ